MSAKRISLKIIHRILIFLILLSSFYILADTQVKAQEAVIEKSSVDKEDISDKQAKEQKEIEAAKEKAREAKTEAEAAKKEADIHKKAVEVEKKKLEVKLKEAETAKKEAEVIKDAARSKEEVSGLLEIARQKEKEAQAAQEKVKIAAEKMLTLRERVKLAEEELKIAQARAAAAEMKIKERQSVIYRKLFQSGLVLFIGYLLLSILVSIINRHIKNLKTKHNARKNLTYFFNLLIILAIVFVWIQNINSITIFLSVVGAGIALALQEVILCIAGWFLILTRRPFEIGDRIELGGVKGDVIDIRLFQTSVLEIGNWVEADQSTGRIVNIPNSAVFKKENYNYNRGFEFIWNEIKILVTFESDWKRAEEIMMRHGIKEAEGMEEVVKRKIEDMTRRYMIYYEKLTPIVYIDIKDSGVQLTLRYLTKARKRRASSDELCRAILNDFEKEERVNFAYPTYRIVK